MSALSINTDPPASPVEVWLTKKTFEIDCMIVHENESTERIDVDSLSMRGAQREVTGWLLNRGYKPAGRWESVEEGETCRKFQVGKRTNADDIERTEG